MKITHNNIMPNFSTFIDDVLGSETFETVKRNLINTTPLANIFETDTTHLIELAVPGIKKDDIKIELIENKLTINLSEAEKIEKTNLKERREFNYTKFSRAFNLPKNIDVEKIEAKNENGILTITIPKKEKELKKNRTITIS